MTKQESIGLRLRKTFLSEEIIKDFSALDNLINFYFPKCKLAVEIDELGHADRDSVKKIKDKQKQQNIQTVNLLELILIKTFLVLMMDLVKYLNLMLKDKKLGKRK